jgi:hypothetical protein
MKKHEHELRALNNSSAGYYGILLFCVHCGKAFCYDSNWNVISIEAYYG